MSSSGPLVKVGDHVPGYGHVWNIPIAYMRRVDSYTHRAASFTLALLIIVSDNCPIVFGSDSVYFPIGNRSTRLRRP